MNYNLLNEKWIPVLWSDGKSGRLGIKDTLAQAGRIRQIASSNPMDRLAILRFLMAILYWLQGNPPNNVDIVCSDSFPEEWFSRLDDNKDLFNLFGDGTRFYQYSKAKRSRPVTDLIQEIPTGNNFWHFRHSIDGVNGLCPACCVLGLLRLPLFSLSGTTGRGNPNVMSGINGVPPIYVAPCGNSLLQTLLLNWLPCKNIGEPTWIHPDNCSAPDGDVPLLFGLTLLARRVWLHDPVEQADACINCGERETALIRECMFDSAGKQENDRWDDPHVLYSDSKPRKTSEASNLTKSRGFSMDRPWPDLFLDILKSSKTKFGTKPTSLLVIGFATKLAVSVDVWERTVTIPSKTLENTPTLIRQWGKNTQSIKNKLRKLKISKEESAAMLATVSPHVEGKVSEKTEELLAGDDDAWKWAAKEYSSTMKIIAQSIAPGFTTEEVERRKMIESLVPELRQKTGNPKGEKGDKK